MEKNHSEDNISERAAFDKFLVPENVENHGQVVVRVHLRTSRYTWCEILSLD